MKKIHLLLIKLLVEKFGNFQFKPTNFNKYTQSLLPKNLGTLDSVIYSSMFSPSPHNLNLGGRGPLNINYTGTKGFKIPISWFIPSRSVQTFQLIILICRRVIYFVYHYQGPTTNYRQLSYLSVLPFPEECQQFGR